MVYFFNLHKLRRNMLLFVYTMAITHTPCREREIVKAEYAPHSCCLISRVMSGGGSLLGCSSFAAAHPREV